jgi:hypothetical protein
VFMTENKKWGKEEGREKEEKREGERGKERK